MVRSGVILKAAILLAGISSAAAAAQPIQLASYPALSPDGKRLAFAWNGDIWQVASEGGVAEPLTTAPSTESYPIYSPAGDKLALISDRMGSGQLFVMDLEEGIPVQRTYHSEGCRVEAWMPDGNSLLIHANRDHFWRHVGRFFRIADEPRPTEELLFDAYGGQGDIDSEGRRLLFTREGEAWWRQGYRGSRAGQVWIYDMDSGEFRKLVHKDTSSRSPLWMPDGKGFYYVSGESGSMNLWQRDLESGEEKQLTHFRKDPVVQPCIARDGSTIVFRHQFDLYRLQPGSDDGPKKLEILPSGDFMPEDIERRTLDSASEVAFTDDGLEVAFIAGGDLWVMDTELREPRQVTDTPEEEHSPVFSPDPETLLFVSDAEGQSDIWQATREDAEKFWWQNEEFALERLTQSAETERGLRWSPTGELVAFVRERGDLWVMQPDGSKARRLLRSWNGPQFDWSPDGKWIVYATDDPNFNRDIYILPVDGSREPVNISRHPDNENRPRWSPDGEAIAFTGRRVGDEVDIYYVYLRKEVHQEESRDRKLKEAIKKIQEVRKQNSSDEEEAADNEEDASDEQEAEDEEEADKDKEEEVEPVVIDFEDIHERVRRVSIPNTAERNLFWSDDSEKLAFTATIDGKRGTYTIAPPDDLEPKLLSTKTGRQARWIKRGNQIVWLSGGKPASLSHKGSASSYSFTARQMVDLPAKYEAAFRQCWRAMRDHFYDGRLNNLNWDAVRREYAPLARAAVDREMLSQVINMMLGELNASHMGFRLNRNSDSDDDRWEETTAHLGVRFDPDHKGPGLLVRDVIPEGPADKVGVEIQPGEVVLSIDDVAVDPAMNLTKLLNGPLKRDIRLRVRDGQGDDRDLVIRPISYSAARSALYEKWVRDNQKWVEESSEAALGYLHIRGMNMSSFYRFQRELYAVAAGKEGIVIDVRENGGGFTTDHLLTALTQPEHAITVPRGGDAGYPQDRSVYATWQKPIVVLCNQNSFSNAEIFSHAIKTLKRGELIGVTTAGGVISTGSRRIMDLGRVRMPFRGWFVLPTGEDMELSGAVPHHIIWPAPGELPAGKDRQLDKGIEVLKGSVEEWKKRPRPELRRASERRAEEQG